MAHLKFHQDIMESFSIRLKEKGFDFPHDDLSNIIDLIEDEILARYVDRLISQVDAIIEISPSLDEREILQALAKIVAQYLQAEATSIRVHDPKCKAMISFGSYPESSILLEEAISFEDSIAGEVVKTGRSYIVPNLLKEEKYRNKVKAEKLGLHSMLAIPFFIPRYSLRDFDLDGAIQIYYKEEERNFAPLEIKIAEALSKRVSYVIARKRIMDLQKMNMTKDKIVEQIFLKLGKKEGIKMRDVFSLVIPDLVDIMKIQRCSLFSVMEDRERVILEAGHPEREHGIGKVFSVSEPYIDKVVNQTGPFGEFEHEKIDPDYILIKNPRESHLLPAHLKNFLERQEIHLVLYIPLKINEVVKYFLVFDAQAEQQEFSREEVEILTFLGKELMKGLKLEKMDDTLHDFKNPAIAAAGFAKRVKKILKEEKSLLEREKIDQALDIIIEETSYLQDLALTLHGEGKEVIIDLTPRLKRRFLVNEEVMKELKKGNIRLSDGQLDSPLWVRCFPIHIDRVLDNLLNNASNAIPEEGGELSIRSYRQDSWAVAEISNTGQISEEEKRRFLGWDTRGRGLHTATRLVKHMSGKIEVESQWGQSTFRVLLPLVNP
jgi:signal transduction histidine kinase